MIDPFLYQLRSGVSEVPAGPVDLALWSTVPAIHDGYAGVSGHFMATLAALKNLRRGGASVVIVIMLCKSNGYHLDALIAFARRLEPTAVQVRLCTEGDGGKLYRLELLEMAWSRLPEETITSVTWADLPHCVAPPHAKMLEQTYTGTYGGQCDHCALRGDCKGFPVGYVARYGIPQVGPVED